jgi:hypothetical protein
MRLHGLYLGLDLVMGDGSLLHFDLSNTVLQFATLPLFLAHARNKEWRMSEQVVHLFERTFGSLRKETVEEDCIGKVANLWIRLDPHS